MKLVTKRNIKYANWFIQFALTPYIRENVLAESSRIVGVFLSNYGFSNKN